MGELRKTYSHSPLEILRGLYTANLREGQLPSVQTKRFFCARARTKTDKRAPSLLTRDFFVQGDRFFASSDSAAVTLRAAHELHLRLQPTTLREKWGTTARKRIRKMDAILGVKPLLIQEKT
jgi:hypothetical protein